MDDLVVGDLRIHLRESAGCVRLDWEGKSNNREPAKVITPFLVGVLTRAEAVRGVVEAHFESLEHFNSSTITALIQFIQTSRNRGITLVIVYDANLKWQRLSFDALRIFEKGDGILRFQTTTKAS